MLTAVFRKSARTKKAEPVSRWQSRQWQARTLMGGPVTTYFTAPQKHWPVLVADLLMDDSLMSDYTWRNHQPPTQKIPRKIPLPQLYRPMKAGSESALLEKFKITKMKTQTIKRALLVLAAAAFAWLAWKAPAQDITAAGATPQMSYGAQQVLKLEQAKVGDPTIIAYINNSQTSYGLNAEQIIYLRQQGVSEAVITAMLTQSSPAAAPAAQAPPAATASPPPATAPATPAADPTIVTTVTAPPAVTYVQSSPTVYYYPDYDYPSYGCYGWPVSVSLGWYWYGGGWHWGGGWHGGYWHGGWNSGWHGGGWNNSWHSGGWNSHGGWHGGGGWHH